METPRENLSSSRTIRASGIQWASIATKIGVLSSIYAYIPSWAFNALISGVILETLYTGAVSYFRFDDWKKGKR